MSERKKVGFELISLKVNNSHGIMKEKKGSGHRRHEYSPAW